MKNEKCKLQIANCKRRGMTLIELLVVIFIIILVAAVTLPRLQPIMDHSRIREAARAVQLYLSSARNQAMSTGRSCGVLIEPLPADNGCSMTFKLVETPAPYGGDTIGATATIINTGTQLQNSSTLSTCRISFSPAPSISLNAGDIIQVGYQGYSLLTSKSSSVGTGLVSASMDISHGETPFWLSQPINATGPALSYKIWRWPVATGAATMQLPSPTVIDLTWSGNDPISGSQPTWTVQTPAAASQNPPVQPTQVIIMFAADGRIDWVSNYGSPAGQQPTTSVYLLVGMRNKVFDNPSGNPNTNLNDFNSLWVAIDAATGLIVVADPAALPRAQPVSTTQPITSNDVSNSRAFARQAIVNVGGK